MSEGQPVHAVHSMQLPPTCEAGGAAIHTCCALTHPLKVFLCVRHPHLHDSHSCSAWRQRRQGQWGNSVAGPQGARPLPAPIYSPSRAGGVQLCGAPGPPNHAHHKSTATTHPPSSSSSTISLDSQASASRMLSSCMNRRSVVMPAALYAPRSPAGHGEHVWRCSPECQACDAGSRQQHSGSQHKHPPHQSMRTAANALQLALHDFTRHKSEECLQALGGAALGGLPTKAAGSNMHQAEWAE